MQLYHKINGKNTIQKEEGKTAFFNLKYHLQLVTFDLKINKVFFRPLGVVITISFSNAF